MTLKELVKSIDKKEWLFVGIISLILMALTAMPYFYGYLQTPPASQYRGINLLGAADFSVYFSYINQIKAGNFLLRDFFTGEQNQTGIFNIFWLGVGLMARLFNLSAPIAYHLSRLALIPVLAAIFYVFSSYFFQKKILRKWSLIFAAFASGVGSVYGVISQGGLIKSFFLIDHNYAIDIWVMEANFFLSIYENPHFILSIALMLVFFLLLLLAWENNNYFYSLIAGLSGLLWFNFHPYYAPYVYVIGFVFTVFLIAKNRKISYLYHYLISAAISLIAVGYYYYVTRVDLVVGVKTLQNITITPKIWFVIVGFGFLLPGSILGIFYAAKNFGIKSDKFLFLIFWLIIGFNLLYAPLEFNRRFTEGLQIPMIILTVCGIYFFYLWIKSRWPRLAGILSYKILTAVLFIIFFCLTTIYVLGADYLFSQQRHSYFYNSKKYLEAVNFLGNLPRSQVILCQQYNGSVIPGLINQQVFIGHGHETAFYLDKKKQQEDFWAGRYTSPEALAFLKNNNISLIFYTGFEQSYDRLNLPIQPYVQQIFNNGEVEIFKVNN